MKKLFLFFFLFVSLFGISFGENNKFELEYLTTGNNAPSITRGGVDVLKVQLRISNSTGVKSGDYIFKSPAGLYIKNPTVTNAVTLKLNDSSNELTIAVGNNSATSIDVEMDVWAGQCFTFGVNDPNTLSLNAPFSLVLQSDNTPLSLLGNNTVNIHKGGFLNYISNESVTEALPDQNRSVAFSYILLNNSSEDFTGNISFQESAVGTGYDIQQVNFYKWNGSAWILISGVTNPIANTKIGINDNDFITTQAVNVAATILKNGKIKVEEIVKLNGCLQNVNTNRSTPQLKWGNASYDVCATPGVPLQTFITISQLLPKLVRKDLTGPNHSCFGGTSLRSYEIKNTGNDVAQNVMIDLGVLEYFTTPFFIPYVPNVNNDNNDIYLMVNGVKYIINFDKYTLNNNTIYSKDNHPSFVPDRYWTNGNEGWARSGFDLYNTDYRNKSNGLVPINGYFTLNEIINHFPYLSQDAFQFSATCIGGFDTKIIKDLYIDEYKPAGSTGNFEPINIKPGDAVVLYWNEARCCFKNETESSDIASSDVWVEYDGLCGRQRDGFSLTDRSLIQHKLVPAPTSGTTVGDVDRCTSTSDGLVERISSTITGPGAFLTPGNYVTRSGRIVFRLYLQNGLDLDKSLTQPMNWGWTHLGYDNVEDQMLFVDNKASQCEGVCTDPAVCDPTKVINTLAGKYYVRLRPNSGPKDQYILPQSIQLIESDSKVQNFGDPLSNLAQPLNNALIFQNNSLYANQLYEIAFSVDDLLKFYERYGSAVEANNLNNLNKLLLESILDFDVRAYCSINGKPSYKVVMYHDRCTGAPAANQSGSCSPGFTSMQPISSFSNSMIINCPGCKIPGANVEISFLERSDNSKGLADRNGDRIPDVPNKVLDKGHPTLKNVAMGDEMTANFTCYMSDGESVNTGEGVSKTELNTAAAGNANLYLDNFIINGVFSGGAFSSGLNKNIEIIKLKMTYKNDVVTVQPGDGKFDKILYHDAAASFIIRGNIDLFQSYKDNLSFEVGAQNGITVELTYRIGDMGNKVIIPEITYAPYYTPCDDCNTLLGNVMTEVNPASNVDFRPFTFNKLIPLGDKTLWKCTGFSNKFKFIPYFQRVYYQPGGGNCTKSTQINFEGKFGENAQADLFEEEYRVFLKSDLKVEVVIPNGYLASEIQIINQFRIGATTYYETYDITDATIISGLLNSTTGNAEYSKYCKLSLHYAPMTGSTVFVQNRKISNVLPDGTVASLTQGDESYNVQVIVFYTKDPNTVCSAIPDYKLYDQYAPTLFLNKSNIPSNNGTHLAQGNDIISVNPNAVLSTTSDLIVLYTHSPGGIYKKPNANISQLNLGSTAIKVHTSDLIQIPIQITNTYPTNEYSVMLAEFPYFHIYGDALNKGLEFVGVYQGAANISAPQATNYYSEFFNKSATNLLTDGIIVGIDRSPAHTRNPLYNPLPSLIGDNNQPMIRTYTLVFRNSCPDNCFQNIGCGTDNTLPANCLFGENNLKIAVGWSCGAFPTFQELNANKTCGAYAPINYTVNIEPVGLTVNTSLNGSAVTESQTLELNPCNVDNAYKITLNSCKETGFTEFEIEFSGISSEISITPPATAGSFTVTRDISNLKLFHLTCSSCALANETVDVDFIIKSSCKISGENLKTVIRSKTFCTPTAVPYFTFNNPLQMKVDPLTSLSDKIQLASQNITVANGNHLNIGYSLIGAANGVTKFDNMILVKIFKGTTSVYAETITIPAGTPDGTITQNLALGIAECGSYTAVLTPQLITVPPCGIVNDVIIPECKNIVNGTSVSKNVLLGNPVVAAITTADGYASFICGSGSNVTFVAYPQGTEYSYSWTGPGIVGATNTNTIVASAVGTYSVTITNLCGSATASANVVNSLDVNCPAPICPGEIPDIVVTNFNGVVGTYKSQWYNPSGTDGNTAADFADDILMDKGIFTSGYYYAATITPSCTLRTNARVPQKCPITVKRAPNAYHITSDRPSGDAPVLFLCDGQTTVLSVTNKSVNSAFPTDVIWRSGQTTTDDITAPGTWTSPGNLLTAQELEKSDYFIVAIDRETHCRTSSNEIAIETPRVGIIRTCDDGDGVKLTAVSNFNVPSTEYEWQLDGMPLVQGTNEVHAVTAGVYTVVEKSTGCALTNKCWGIKENLNIHATSNQELLSLQVGGFEGITATDIPLGFDTDFTPLDRTGYNGATLPADYTIGKFMINQSGLQASDWSPNVPSTWISTNTNYSGNGAMLIDGESEPEPKLIWGKTVPVTHGLNYLYRFNVRNINLLTQYPVEEIPELYVQITYTDGAGNGTRYRTNKQALFDNGQTPWIEFSSYTPAIPVTIFDCLSPSEIQTVRLELFMDGGGSIGRDISVDDVSFIPVGICDDVITLDLPCNAALADLDNNQLIVCPGSTAQFNVINAPAGLTYQWQQFADGVPSTVSSGSSFTTPVLNLIDPLKPAFFNYQVTISDPVNHCQTKLAAKAIVSTLPKVTITNDWVGSNCETEFDAVFDGLGTPTQYEWYLNGTQVNAETNATYVVRNLNRGDVIQANVRNVWCSGTAPVESNTISITDAGLRADAGADKTICAGESIRVGTAAVNNAIYSWTPLADLDDAAKAQPVYTPSVAAATVEFTLTLTDLTTGCISEDRTTVITNPLPTLVITNPTFVCEPATVDITAPEVTQGSTSGLAYTYFSDAAEQNGVLNPNSISVAGTYYIKGKTAEGCSINKPVAVDIKMQPDVIITNPAAVYAPNTVDLTLPAVTIGSTTGLIYTYFTDDKAATSLPNPTAVANTGTYYIKGTTSNGCSDISPVTVSINSQPLSTKGVLNGTMEVTLNPNPFSEEAYMTVTGASSDYVKATIVDMNGKVLFEDAYILNNETTVIGHDLPSAVYILKIIDGDKINMIKFVKL